MSFYSVAPLLKKQKKMVLFDDFRGRQWVGDSCAAYRLYDMPSLVDHDNLFDLMGVEKDKRSGWTLFDKNLPEVTLGEYGDYIAWGVPVINDGLLYQVIRSHGEVVCVLEEYLKPLRSFKDKEYRIEVLENGLRYLIVSIGCFDLAVICGEPVGQEFVGKLQGTVDALKSIAVPGEKRLFDDDTGEVLADEQQGDAGAEDAL